MTKTCTVPRCTEAASGFSQHCDAHKKHQRRHGHPQQACVTVHQLAPYLRLVNARRAKNPTSDLWAILEARWAAVVANAVGVVAQYTAGATMVGAEVRAAEQVQRLAGEVPAGSVADVVLALYLMRDAEPRRFQSDRAFLFQVVRRVRGLTSSNAGLYWDHAKRRSRRVYQDPAPRLVEHLAGLLVASFGAVGLMLAGREREERNAPQVEAERLARAMEALA